MVPKRKREREMIFLLKIHSKFSYWAKKTDITYREIQANEKSKRDLKWVEMLGGTVPSYGDLAFLIRPQGRWSDPWPDNRTNHLISGVYDHHLHSE